MPGGFDRITASNGAYAVPPAEKPMKRITLSLFLCLGLLRGPAQPRRHAADRARPGGVRRQPARAWRLDGAGRSAVRRAAAEVRRRRRRKQQHSADHPLAVPGFTVYFENNHVVDAVAEQGQRTEIGPSRPSKNSMSKLPAFPRGMGTPVRDPDRVAARRHRLGRAPGRASRPPMSRWSRRSPVSSRP